MTALYCIVNNSKKDSNNDGLIKQTAIFRSKEADFFVIAFAAIILLLIEELFYSKFRCWAI